MTSDGSLPSADLVIVTKAETVKYDALSLALALPDAASASSPCPADTTLPVVILVETQNGPWLVHVPVDACGNPPEALASALTLP